MALNINNLPSEIVEDHIFGNFWLDVDGYHADTWCSIARTCQSWLNIYHRYLLKVYNSTKAEGRRMSYECVYFQCSVGKMLFDITIHMTKYRFIKYKQAVGAVEPEEHVWQSFGHAIGITATFLISDVKLSVEWHTQRVTTHSLGDIQVSDDIARIAVMIVKKYILLAVKVKFPDSPILTKHAKLNTVGRKLKRMLGE